MLMLGAVLVAMGGGLCSCKKDKDGGDSGAGKENSGGKSGKANGQGNTGGGAQAGNGNTQGNAGGGNPGGGGVTPDPGKPEEPKPGPVELEVSMPGGVYEVSRGKSITLPLRVRQANAPANANIGLYCVDNNGTVFLEAIELGDGRTMSIPKNEGVTMGGVRQVKRVIGQGNGDFNIRLRVRANRDISDDMLAHNDKDTAMTVMRQV